MKRTDRLIAPAIWIAVLAAGLAWLGLPLDRQPGWPVVLGFVLATALGLAGLLVWRHRRLPDSTAAGDDMPAGGARELPVVLVVGPYASAAFSRGAQSLTLRRDGAAAWLYVKTPGDLARAIDIVAKSHGRPPVAALLPVIPEGNDDDGVLRREFSQWRRALDATFDKRASVLPCYIAVYACLGAHDEAAPQPVWFGDFIDATVAMPGIDHLRQRVQTIRDQLDRAALTSDGAGHIVRAALGQSVLDWLQDASLLSALAPLTSTAPFELRGLLLADVGYPVSRAGAWTRWLVAKTGLQPLAGTLPAQPLPLPAIVATQPGSTAVMAHGHALTRPGWHVAGAVAVTLAASFAVSGWRNGNLIERVTGEIDASRATPREQFDARRDRLDTLQQRYAELERYAQSGEPTSLGWGLYRGTPLQSALARTIEAEGAIPDGVTLDSVALFDSGRTTLKPGATDALQTVLHLILLNPDKRVLIAGHTDDVGSGDVNQTLSEARARAIRDWFVATAKLPPTRFAIQGYGDTRPLASNRDERGRARNRRVEITLIPDATAAGTSLPH
ncbi:OmpA family protein [Paraburkholderia caballeronis]|uniref:OmpA family protein n=1 Tax=Paraburkholderia caballeronis TaxID=416943 RepID=UPI00106482E9|nr:OmpA family protein [Paraburkholderia caballeronis]TDV35650.1 OmpA family protein [Paraburkholderia caballeronis]